MNIEYFEDLDKINLNLLPATIEREYNKIRFQFDTDFMGTYFSRNAFNNLYADIYYVFSEKELTKRQLFNENLRNSKDAYREGFTDGSYNINIFKGIPKEKDQIFKVFGMVYKKLDSIDKPSILQFKKNIDIYNKLDFLQHHLSEYGEDVGRFIFGWTIILNNINLFEKIFDEKLGAKTSHSSEEPTKNNQYKPPTPPEKTQTILSDLITHEKSVEIVKSIKIQYKNIKGKRLKLLLLAFQELELLPKERIAFKFHDCCKIEFEWDISSYNAMNGYTFNKGIDNDEIIAMKEYIKAQINAN